MAITVKLTDGGSNTLTFDIDAYQEEDIDNDVFERSTDKTLLHYALTSKKRFVLGLNNILAADKTTLATIKNLQTTLEFYRDSASTKTADVFWMNSFSHTPTGKHRYFVDKIYEMEIILEEV